MGMSFTCKLSEQYAMCPYSKRKKADHALEQHSPYLQRDLSSKSHQLFSLGKGFGGQEGLRGKVFHMLAEPFILWVLQHSVNLC